MITCPTCKGSGKYNMPVTTHDEKGCNTTYFEMTCQKCNGSGEVDPVVEKKREKASKAFWCGCENSSGHFYVEDGVSKKCQQHHWVCNDCGKVTQVG